MGESAWHTSGLLAVLDLLFFDDDIVDGFQKIFFEIVNLNPGVNIADRASDITGEKVQHLFCRRSINAEPLDRFPP